MRLKKTARKAAKGRAWAISKRAGVRTHIDLPTVMHVAKLARLNLTKKEAKRYQKELGEILSAFGEIKRIKTDAQPSFHPMDVKDVFRKDETEKCLPNEVALQNTEHKEKGFFRGPRAV